MRWRGGKLAVHSFVLCPKAATTMDEVFAETDVALWWGRQFKAWDRKRHVVLTAPGTMEDERRLAEFSLCHWVRDWRGRVSNIG
mgnify:FL=1